MQLVLARNIIQTDAILTKNFMHTLNNWSCHMEFMTNTKYNKIKLQYFELTNDNNILWLEKNNSAFSN